jgi:hypothetical protein
MIEVRFIDSDEKLGVEAIKSRYHIKQSEAYHRSNEALHHLAKLIFG